METKNKRIIGIFIPNARFYLGIIFLLIIVIAFLSWKVAIIGGILFIGLVYYNFRSNYIRKREVTKYIENLTFNIDTATKDTLLNFPMPLVVIELDGTIIWYNSSFRQIFDGEDLLEKTIGSFVKDFNPNIFANKTSNNESMSAIKEIVINERSYLVFGNLVKLDDKLNKDNLILVLYFIDNTNYVQLKAKYEQESLIAGIIVIDNYEDVMQSMENAKFPQMLAEIDSKIVKSFSFTDGILKKYERDKYLFLFQYKYIKELEAKRFNILDDVKEINIGNTIPITLSIGIGLKGQSFQESFKYAAASIDLALARGGDQVVVKDGKETQFFGGNSREVEKRTRVKARVIAFALRQLIDDASNVFIMGHENGDIDSLGAALGIYRIAKNRNKNVNIILNYVNPTIYNLMNKIEKNSEYNGVFIGKEDALDKVQNNTLLVIVDTHRPTFTESPEIIEHINKIVVIDHHRRGTEYIQNAVLTYQETYASSTCELVTEILQYIEEKIKLSEIEAESLYAGILVDTKYFTFKTGVRTFEAAAFLRRQGVDTISAKQIFQNDLQSYINISNVVQNAEIIHGTIAISESPQGVKNLQLITAQAADQLIMLSGITAAFVLAFFDGVVYISGRSLGDINVQVILEKLGGGGHLTVAGAQLKDISLSDARLKLKDAIEKFVTSSSKEKE